MGKKGQQKPQGRNLTTIQATGVQDRRKLFARIRRGVVGIAYAPDLPNPDNTNPFAQVNVIGSGFLVDVDRGLVVTAKHVIEPWHQEWTAHTAGQAPQPSVPRIVIVSPSSQGADEVEWAFAMTGLVSWTLHATLDIAVLRFNPLALQEEHRRTLNLLALPLTTESCEEGDEIAVCGFPLGNSLHNDIYGALAPGFDMPAVTASFSRGIVSAVLPFSGSPVELRHYFQMSIMINPGNSGGPVFDTRTGKVVGVVSSASVQRRSLGGAQDDGSNEPIDIPTGLARAVSIHHAHQLILQQSQALIQQVMDQRAQP